MTCQPVLESVPPSASERPQSGRPEPKKIDVNPGVKHIST